MVSFVTFFKYFSNQDDLKKASTSKIYIFVKEYFSEVELAEVQFSSLTTRTMQKIFSLYKELANFNSAPLKKALKCIKSLTKSLKAHQSVLA